MTTTVPSIEPDCFIVGDSVTWKRSFDCYRASDGWTLTYSIKGAANIVDVVAAASGDDHLVTISAATTGAYTAGDYWWQAKASKAGEVITVDHGTLEILADLSTLSAAHDGRTHYQIVLDALEATLQGKATLDQQSYSISGRSISRLSPQEILDWIDKYRSLVNRDKNKEALRRGTGKGSNKVGVRFT